MAERKAKFINQHIMRQLLFEDYLEKGEKKRIAELEKLISETNSKEDAYLYNKMIYDRIHRAKLRKEKHEIESERRRYARRK